MGGRRDERVQFRSKTPDLFLRKLSRAPSDPLYMVPSVSKGLVRLLGRSFWWYFWIDKLVWPNHRFTDSNLGVAILTLWLFATRMSLRCLGITNKCTEFFLQCCLFFFWILCLAGQLSPDYSDSQHPSRLPWYLTHTCSVAQPVNQRACHIAQASFGFSVITT